MRLFATLLFCLITSLAIAEDTVFISTLTNGTPPTVNMSRCDRVSELPFTCRGLDTLALLNPGGVTSLQPNGVNQLHVYWTEQSGIKARIKRVTFDLGLSQFLPASIKAYPANLANIQFLSLNDRKGAVQKLPGTRLSRFNVNPPGNVFPGPLLPGFPAAPIGAQISDDKNPILAAIWSDVNTGKTGGTISHLNPPLDAANFLFSGIDQPRAIDVSRVFDVNTSSAHFYFISDDWRIKPNLTLDAPFARKIAVTNTNGSLQKAAFTTIGKAIQLAPFRRTVRPDAVPFNGIGIDPLAIAIVYLRGNAAQASNDILLQTFNPVLGRKIGPPKLVKRGARGSVNYGISVWNPKFRNGLD